MSNVSKNLWCSNSTFLATIMSLVKETDMRVLADAACSAAANGEKNAQKQIVASRGKAKRTKRKFGFADFTNVDDAQKDKARVTDVLKRFNWGELSVSVSSDVPDYVRINFGPKIHVKLFGDAECFANILVRATQAVKDFAQKSAQQSQRDIKIRYDYLTTHIYVDSNVDSLEIVFANDFVCKISVLTAQHLAEMVVEAAKAQKEFQ